ncbi:MAG: hypothetical protein V4598_19740 [Bdellovibrionota bacterium]
MKKLFSALLILLTISILSPKRAEAQIPVKAKAFLTIVGYGTAGGAILGAASMAFGTSTRAVTQGASLGLYAGILFGTYVLVSHAQGRQGSYSDDSSPYKESNDVYGDEYNSENGGGEGEEKSRQGFFNRFEDMNQKFGQKAKGGNLPPITVNLLNLEF